MKAILARGDSTDQGTAGVLRFGDRAVHTIELPWRDNTPQRSCIPAGEYRMEIVNSPRFGRVYQVFGVPGRNSVLIHPANFGGDVELGWTTELHGCIAPANHIGAMRNPAGAMQLAGLVSRPAWSSFMAWAGGQPLTLEIVQ